MALVPAVTNITSHVAAWTASGIIDALHAHITADGVHLKVDAYTVGEGLTVGFATPGEIHQTNLRKSAATTIAVSIEPAGSITDPGDSSPTAPTGTTADWSGARAGDPSFDVTWGSPGAGSRLWCIEVPDAFFLLATNTANTFHVWGLHAGRITTSILSSGAASAGQDGLGFFAGVPDDGSGSGNDWTGVNSPCASLHWATEEWSDHITEIQPSTAQVADPAQTNYRPLVPNMMLAYHITGNNTTSSILGPSKYLRRTQQNQPPCTVWADGASDQGWMAIHDVIGSANLTVVWDKTVTP